MTLTYNLTEEDYLNHQLFMASLSDRVKAQRRRSRLIWFIVFFSLALLSYQRKDSFLTYYFLGFAIFYILFHPLYSRWLYKRHYKKNVAETYKNRFDKNSTITIDSEQIHDIDETSETKISTSEIEKTYETSKYIFLKLKSGLTLIIPKFKVQNLDLVIQELKAIANMRQADYIEMLNWHWR